MQKREHQIEAHDAMAAELAVAGRGTAVMACASGKTFCQAFLAEAMIAATDDPEPVIVCLVPNRALVRQNANTLRAVLGDRVDYFGVFSSDDRREGEIDEENEATFDFFVSTDADQIRSKIDGSRKPKVVISTYQSAQTAQVALSHDGVQKDVLLGIFDEAHRTAGDKDIGSQFAFALDDENFRMLKRAFYTATPRIETGRGETNKNISMDDEALYGRIVYDYPFSRAIAEGRVADYDLIAARVGTEEIEALAAEYGISLPPDDDAARLAEMRKLAGELAVARHIEETGQTRILTYHRTVADAESFSERLSGTYTARGYSVGTVSADTSSSERAALLGALASRPSIIGNCKALVEGVDVPGLQAALFVDPRKSVVETVQAIGRVARLDPNDPSKTGSIIVPLIEISGGTETAFQLADDQGYKALVQVALAVKASKDTVSEDIRTASRLAASSGEPAELPLDIKVYATDKTLSDADLAAFAREIRTHLFEDVKDSFSEKFGRLEKHIAEHDELPNSKSDLYYFVRHARNRHKEGKLSADHAAMFDALPGWSWIGERDRANSAAIAAHIAAFHNRCTALPGAGDDRQAVAELGRHGDAMETAAAKILDMRSEREKDDWARLRPGAEELDRRGLLFSGDRQPPLPVAGRFILPEHGDGKEVYFQAAGDMTYFGSGRRGAGQMIGLKVSNDERERIEALGARHRVEITLTRAGIEKSYRKDGKIAAWHGIETDRGEPKKPGTVPYLLDRLHDRKAAGLPAYTAANARKGHIDLKAPVTDLSKAPVAELPVGHLMKNIQVVQLRHAKAELSESVVAALDAAPGFSWIERGRAAGTLGPAVAAIAARHGEEILCDLAARRGDRGLANTLRAVDALVLRRKERPDLDSDFVRMARDGHLRTLSCFTEARKRKSKDHATRLPAQASHHR